jgi:hypothetical protein
LRTAAQAQGLSGVYIVGGFGTPDGTIGQHSLSDGFSIAQADGYDAIASYNYPFAPPAVNGAAFLDPFRCGTLDLERSNAEQYAPIHPDCHGWDPRPGMKQSQPPGI